MSVLETNTIDGVTYDLHDKLVGSGTLQTTAQTLIPAVNELKTQVTAIEAELEDDLRLVSWANGTWVQLYDMLDAHYRGEINIHDYWSVGDKKVISINGNPRELVLQHAGELKLQTAINGIDTCAFVVGFGSNSLTFWPSMFGLESSPSYSSASTWKACGVRTALNGTAFYALPEGFREIAKPFKNYRVNSARTALEQSIDVMSLAAEAQIFGNVTMGDTHESSLTQFTWYTTPTNRVKLYQNSSYSFPTSSLFTYTSGDYSYNYFVSCKATTSDTTAREKSLTGNYAYSFAGAFFVI